MLGQFAQVSKEIQMSQEKPIKPAPYSQTDTSETLSVDIFKKLVDHYRVKLDIKERDKIPNIDGYMELVDDGGVPCGKLEVQIKKLPDYMSKIQIPMSLFAYSEYATCNPVILVGVDTKSEKVFWFHVNSKLLASPIDKIQQASLTISFPPANVIDGVSTQYLTEWKIIVDSYLRLKIIDKKYEKLRANSNPIVGVTNKDFIDIQIFLDELNGLLDGKFSIVKRAFFPTSWKTGFAYYSYKENSVDFSLYPIPYGKNDVLIKEMDEKLRQELRDSGLATQGFYRENPVRSHPKKLAVDEIEQKIKEILEAKLLKHTSSEFLVREFTFAFIDKFHIQMGLPKKDSYSLSEIEKGFFEYLPVWTVESIKFMIDVRRNGIESFGQALYRRPYFDPSLLLSQIMPGEREEVKHRVEKALEGKGQLPIMPLGNKDLSFRLFYESLSSLKIRGTTEVARPYLPKDFTRLGKFGGWVWNVFSLETLEKNLSIFFDNLPDVYDKVITANFQDIKDDIPLFGNVDLEIILLDAKEEVKACTDAPLMGYYGLSLSNKEKMSVRFSRRENAGSFSSLSMKQFQQEMLIDGKTYKMVTAKGQVLHFIYEDTPMLDFIYNEIKDNLSRYFNNLRKDYEEKRVQPS
jgi:hypothetical protein